MGSHALKYLGPTLITHSLVREWCCWLWITVCLYAPLFPFVQVCSDVLTPPP